MSLKKKTPLNQIMPVRHTILSAQGTVIKKFLNWSIVKKAKKTKLTQERRQSLIMGSNGTECILSDWEYIWVYKEDLIASFLSLLKVKHWRKVNSPVENTFSLLSLFTNTFIRMLPYEELQRFQHRTSWFSLVIPVGDKNCSSNGSQQKKSTVMCRTDLSLSMS